MEDKDKNKKQDLKDYEGGYGGGRERVEQMHEHAFGERGWTNRGGDEPKPSGEEKVEVPEGVHETHDPNWQQKFVRENADKYGQSGGKPIEQRGEAQSKGGKPDEEPPRGTYTGVEDAEPKG